MLMEGTGKYFLMILFVFFIVYVAVKISLGYLLKKARVDAWRGYIPIYTIWVIIDLVGMKKKYFYLSLIPFVNLYFLNKILKEFLKGFKENPNESIWYIIFPMYNFPKLVFKNPTFIMNEYDLTEQFVKTENIIFEKPEKKKKKPKRNEYVPDQEPTTDSNENQVNPENVETVFTNEELQPDETFTTYVEAEKPEEEEEKPAIIPAAQGRPKLCPKCGARLAPDATVCFLCGTKL